jgi:hypothetical protein
MIAAYGSTEPVTAKLRAGREVGDFDEGVL